MRGGEKAGGGLRGKPNCEPQWVERVNFRTPDWRVPG